MTNGRCVMLEFQPEIEETMKARYADALNPIYDIVLIQQGKQERPGLMRKHIFDFFDGVRLIVSRERESFMTMTHYSVSVQTPTEFECVGQFIEYVIMHINLIKPQPLKGILDAFSDGNVLHILVCEEAANARLN